MIDYRKELNEAQAQSVLYSGGPQLVIAGAGSGKTRVLTYKIAYLLERGYDPHRIMALTFTNKAANEMKSRLAVLVGNQKAKALHVGTFHSVLAKFLRKEIAKGYLCASYTSSFTIYDQRSSEDVIGKIIKEMELPDTYLVKDIAARISRAKNHMVTSDAYGMSEFYRKDCHDRLRQTSAIYGRYTEKLHLYNAMDFDDILLNTYLHFRRNEDRRLVCSRYIDYCLVDEYQDTNVIQKVIIAQLTKEKRNLFVVGDDAQSIYGFRGAVIGNILNFEEDFPDAREFKLEQNYRSTQTIVDAANCLIAKNRSQRKKTVFTQNERGQSIVLVRKDNDKGEATFVAETIKEMVRDGSYGYGDFAILYRNNSLSRMIENRFVANGIKHVIYGDVGFFERREIRDCFAYFRSILNPDDDYSLGRILNYPKRDVGGTTLSKLLDIARYNGMSLWRVLSSPSNYSLAVKRQKAREGLGGFVRMMESWRNLLSSDASLIAEKIISDTRMIDTLKDEDKKEGSNRADNVYQLLSDIREFVAENSHADGTPVTLGEYVADRALFTDEDEKKKAIEEGVSVKLMTIHKSKGLEFPVVFVIGMDEGVFPSNKSLESAADFEEERRVCYVAITRAKKELFLTGANCRFLFGKPCMLDPSCFIYDIDPKYLNVIDEY